ncbi:Nose resistant to fluoxetine protein 6 [Dufourea novaeangliae]|uniref:Nose resistant to fluoxetine protein 6 n=1 Tax=Dufourea novaeangliae TaxID=178035 RepID=A0A154PAH9_DUFNO|nr:Nose resistant to fluoxetine protein 6 [Dufourea novaeangliae]
MAAALLGKCIGLSALVLLFYTCCYGFKIREHGPQTIFTSGEQLHRAICASSIFGRCQEKTPTPSTSRKWHETPPPPQLATRRKSPVEMTSDDDDDREGARAKPERIGHSTNRHVDDKSQERSIELEDDDDGDVMVEVEEDSKENNESGEDVVDDSSEDGDEKEEKSEEAEEEEKEYYKVKRKSVEDEKQEVKVDRRKGEMKLTVKKSKEDESLKKNEATLFKGLKKVKYMEGSDGDDIEDIRKKKLEKCSKEIKSREDEDENDDEDEDNDEDEDEDEDGSDEESEEVVTPPPKKLEKVRYADKDKVKSTELPTPVIEKLKVETKKPAEPVKKQEEKSVETAKKPTEIQWKSPVVSKNVETAKTTKSDPESSKPIITSKSETKMVAVKPKEKEMISVTTEASKAKSKEPAKQPEKKKVETVSVRATPAKTAEVKRLDKVSKERTKVHAKVPSTLGQLNDALLSVPTFVPNFTAIEDLECQQHGMIFLRQLRGHKLWALQMLDASAKVPSGLLRGNVNQLGDFDECLGVMAHVKLNNVTIKVQGKYCLAYIDLYASHPDMRLPINMMQARSFIRGNMHDPGHFVPKFTTVNWALCLPAVCSAEDAENILEQALSHYNSTTGIKFTVDVEPHMCYVKEKSDSYSKETIGVLYFYATIVCLVLIATVRDYIVVSERKGNYSERIIMSFSLRRTVRSLLKVHSSEVDITCIHGIRTLVTITLYLAHQLIAISRLPFSNRIDLTEVANNPISSVLRVSMVYTDAFLLLSGVLTAYNMAHELKTRGEIRWFCRLIARYIRLTPALLAVVFWYAFVMEHMGLGPQWNSVVIPNAELCRSNAWTNLLYIQNFFPFEEMCATHSHQLALDMQLSLLAPMLVFFLECKPIIGILLIFFFILLSATLRYIATMSNYLSLVIFHGMSLKHLYKTANLTYMLPLHRATPYVFGVGLGVLLHYTGKNVRIHKVLVILGWLIAMALGSWSLFSPWHLARRDYVYDVEEATNYAVICPVVWALAICWFIFACHTNHGGIINRFMSNHWLVIFSRISYAVYLTQFAVFFFNVGTTRYSTEFQLLRAIDPLEAAVVLAVSIIITLFFDLPMQEIKNVIMESTDIQTVEVSSTEKPASEVIEETQKPIRPDQQPRKVYEEDEVASTGWDWQKDIIQGAAKSNNEVVEDEEQVDMPILKKSGRRKSFISHDSSEGEFVPAWDSVKELDRRYLTNDDVYREIGRRGTSVDRGYRGSEHDEEFFRSQQERDETLVGKERTPSRSSDSKRPFGKSEEYESVQRQTRPHLLSSAPDARKIYSSESEEEISQRRKLEKRHPSVEPRISDEEDWESELRIRRKQFMEKLATQDRESLLEEEDLASLKRRSSAEGKLALLKDPSADDNMDSWTDLSKLSQEDSELSDSGWNVMKKENTDTLPRSTSLGLFKRESIVKSQASEEDPDQQEREHPFKKAWQMQKSRSEEDGKYAIKDARDQAKTELKPKTDDVPTVEREPSGEQSSECEDVASFADDESESISFSRSRSTDTEDNRTYSRSEETASTEGGSANTSFEDNKANSKSDIEEDSSKFNWPDEEEQFEIYKASLKSKSEETDWTWEHEET